MLIPKLGIKELFKGKFFGLMVGLISFAFIVLVDIFRTDIFIIPSFIINGIGYTIGFLASAFMFPPGLEDTISLVLFFLAPVVYGLIFRGVKAWKIYFILNLVIGILFISLILLLHFTDPNIFKALEL